MLDRWLQTLRRRRRLALYQLLLSTLLLLAGSVGRSLELSAWLPALMMLLGVAGQLLALVALSSKPRS
ncbi:hypothetical protein [Crenobacter caeni]|uniref:Uncharacterized protein n=1 Tax=Crenobacter caeni TaxID=2705474 RepID=A0A6B2KWJ8_9NEIS|nr:hypothetical protein [Crenobacter caeni]NDV14380.1 hypothetical protein [Crenobacter caeni]